MTLSVAESCTGGGVAARLVQVPDCSLYFLGGIVCYSRVSKEKFLEVKSDTLARFGEVSSQTVQEMAVGTLTQFSSDIALAITGIAGPSGGSPEKPIGTVYFGIATKGNFPFFWKHLFDGSRPQIISQSIEMALILLWEHLRALSTQSATN